MNGAAWTGLLLVVSGCLAPGPTQPREAPDPLPAASSLFRPTWEFYQCDATLHEWLVAAEDLQARLPSGFAPTAYAATGTETPMGVFASYVLECAFAERNGDRIGGASVGLLAIRVDPPAEVAPPSEPPLWAVGPWGSLYAVAVLSGGSLDEPLGAAGVSFSPVHVAADWGPTPAYDVVRGASEVRHEGRLAFSSEMFGLTGQWDEWWLPERFYRMEDGRLLWLDVAWHLRMWETEGTVNYATGTWWDSWIGGGVQPWTAQHHSIRGWFELAWEAAEAP